MRGLESTSEILTATKRHPIVTLFVLRRPTPVGDPEPRGLSALERTPAWWYGDFQRRGRRAVVHQQPHRGYPHAAHLSAAGTLVRCGADPVLEVTSVGRADT